MNLVFKCQLPALGDPHQESRHFRPQMSLNLSTQFFDTELDKPRKNLVDVKIHTPLQLTGVNFRGQSIDWCLCCCFYQCFPCMAPGVSSFKDMFYHDCLNLSFLAHPLLVFGWLCIISHNFCLYALSLFADLISSSNLSVIIMKINKCTPTGRHRSLLVWMLTR